MRRRELLKLVGGMGLLAALPGCHSTRRPRRIPANGYLNHACIGVGGMGLTDLKNLASHPRCRVTAICDVDAERLEKTAALVPGARRYVDWRDLLDSEGDRIDAINVTVPDHMHAAIALTAIRMARHVYCQKPMCHDVAECRALSSAAASARVVTQLGTQFAAGAGDRQAVRWLQEGVIGHARRVILCSNRPGAERYRIAGPRPYAGAMAPDALAWDLWLGTAPARPYAPDIYHPMRWRSWQDFGTGWSGDIGCHLFDAVWKGLELTAPLSVRARVQESWRDSPARKTDTWPQSNHITWMFPGNQRTGGRELPVDWYDGEFFPPEDVQALARDYGFQSFPAEGSIVVGTEGALLLPHGSGAILLPRHRFADRRKDVLEPRNHYHEFLDACIGGHLPSSHFGISGLMSEAVLLGTIAIRVPDTVLQWDSARLQFMNSADAQRLVRREYRSGWRVSGI